MQSIGAIGCPFAHSTSSTWYRKSKRIRWVYDQVLPTTFWFDNAIQLGVYEQIENKIAWIVESHSICPDAVKFVKENVSLVSQSYKYLFTHSEEIASLADNFHFSFPSSTWIENPQIYPKTKLCSMISSNKGWLPGHKLRLEWVDKLKGKADLYGTGFNRVDKIEDAVKDYMFSIIIENRDDYCSEKVFHAPAVGSIPVYYGAKYAEKFLNKDGIIWLDDDFDVSSLTPELYYSKMDAIKDNLERIQALPWTIEDNIYDIYLAPLVDE